MKRIHTYFLLSILIGITSCVSSKKYNAVQEQRNDLAQDLNACEQQNDNLQASISDLQNDIAEMEETERQLMAAKATISTLSERVENCEYEMTDGVVFKVQIGAYNEKEIPRELDQSANLDIEGTGDMDKIVVGQFREFYKADALQAHLRDIGVEGAWIVAYEDGQRVDLEKVTDTIFETYRD